MVLSKAEIIKIAGFEANRLLLKHKPSYKEPINIFKLIEEKNIILNFQKLDKLAGAYLPETSDSRAGILVNENLPVTRQRYTAAHELCHFVRNDSASIDNASELFMNSYKRNTNEQIAEEFASWILMPRNLVINIAEQVGKNEIEKGKPEHIYELSLRMDTSFQATVNRLLTLKMIKKESYKKLSKINPKDIKDKMRVENLKTSWNNIWHISYKDNNNQIYPIQGDVVKILLEENPTTGYKWLNIPIGEAITSFWEPLNKKNLGGNGLRHIIIEITNKREIPINLTYNRPWLKSSLPIGEFNISIITQFKRHGIKLDQLIA